MSKTHTTNDCHVRNECLKLFQEKKELKNTSETGQLRHLTDENFEDALIEDVVDIVVEHEDNDTNEAELIYLAHLTNHYLRLVKVSTPSVSGPDLRYPIIVDSGANHRMF